MIDVAKEGSVLRPREVRRLGKGLFFQLRRLPRRATAAAVSEGEKDSVRLSAPLLNLIQGRTTPQGPLKGIWRAPQHSIARSPAWAWIRIARVPSSYEPSRAARGPRVVQ